MDVLWIGRRLRGTAVAPPGDWRARVGPLGGQARGVGAGLVWRGGAHPARLPTGA
ncbi:MAG: hypothetical protein MUC97_11680 [Bernardetiaceae bacterium]|nr:hypothetical protein [Bernardetiaceae bacterium]